jgi:hypothetical protein
VDFWVQLLSYINLAGAIHALIQSLVLFITPRGDRRANKFMAVFLLFVGMGMANGIITRLGLYDTQPALAVVMGSLALAYGPLFYFYIRAMTTPTRRLGPQDILHGVPIFVGLAVYAAYLSLRRGGMPPAGIAGWAVRSPWLIVTVLAALQTIVYVGAVVRLLWAHSRRIKSTYSTIDPVSLGWLRRRLVVYAAIWAVGLGLVAAVGFRSPAFGLVAQIIAFLVALNTFVTGYRAMLQPEIYYGPVEEKPGRRYERSSLKPENASLYKERLIDRMAREDRKSVV